MNWSAVSEFLEISNGSVIWKKAKCKAKAGSLFGSDNGTGYLQGTIFGCRVYAHRMAWFLVNKQMPGGEIDHINGVKTDNRVENLRVVNRAQNTENTHKVRSDSKIGIQGVQKNRNKYRARVRVGSTVHSFGGFDTPEEARKAYLAAKRQLHKAYVEVAA